MRLKSKTCIVIVAFFAMPIHVQAKTVSDQVRSLTMPKQLIKLRELKKSDLGSVNVNDENRLKIMQLAGRQAGVQSGYLYRRQVIAQQIEKYKAVFDRVFNFTKFTIVYGDGILLPPIAVQRNNIRSIDSVGNSIRETSLSYKIIKPARLTLSAPNWRSYLYPLIGNNNIKDSTKETEYDLNSQVLPSTDAEVKQWQHSVELGWSSGINQANLEFKVGMDRLYRDYSGMQLSETLISMNVMNKPSLNTEVKNYVVKKSEVNVYDTLTKIKKEASFSSPEKWRVLILENQTEDSVNNSDGMQFHE